MKGVKKILLLILISATIFSCREKYFASYEMPATGFLIVNGFINGGDEPTEIRLSRTNKLSETPAEVMETGATVFIEGENSGRYALTETAPGVYTSESISIGPSSKYRLFINTKDKEYVSEYTGILATPDIDSVSWEQNKEGVQFYINTHDDTNNVRYYQWKFEETWQINSPFITTLEYDYDENKKFVGIKYRYENRMADSTKQMCWTTTFSNSLLIGTTEKLTKDVVSLPFHFIRDGSEKMNVEYSLLVKQYALSQRAYNFLLTMKKNTEQLGSVFDPQPSQLNSNMRCITDPSEMVIGFVEVTKQKTKRIFVKTRELGTWNYYNDCEAKVINNQQPPDSILKYVDNLMPTVVHSEDINTGEILEFNVAPAVCIDCRLKGATNVKPSFWP